GFAVELEVRKIAARFECVEPPALAALVERRIGHDVVGDVILDINARAPAILRTLLLRLDVRRITKGREAGEIAGGRGWRHHIEFGGDKTARRRLLLMRVANAARDPECVGDVPR